MSIITVKSSLTGNSYQYVDNGDPKSGTAKDVYFSPDRKYVVAIFKEKQDFNQKERLTKIVTKYLHQIENKEAGKYYLDEIYRWPTDIIETNNKVGIIVPIYNSKFFSLKVIHQVI
ncbi:hypothetical protein [Pedobacter agri]|uniref:hypothetical protein n=1 Tax=Pedobacter agri TaxID=454586 RepID=UPI00292DD4A4|nr:hypothetical protein [Pedobacter agri]